jgi:hypothetical protein
LQDGQSEAKLIDVPASVMSFACPTGKSVRFCAACSTQGGLAARRNRMCGRADLPSGIKPVRRLKFCAGKYFSFGLSEIVDF